ncbi:39S ribosomal protein L38, mitochondrial-like [Physeter macrocephalus]|uniref:39S ribosomal protein L38, mitochondrial-like n=1 Tax=Physeter macrocephalus TaxID=9755 RepID=A0A2Y9TAW6_PHYMC|nr:39S ribosomal protein L38, mitochondrial-like [Physeter catodon]|eukprot:XP_023985995.1 39S ribosomal protein L38, mitochondrial-like [Physeter catodon]
MAFPRARLWHPHSSPGPGLSSRGGTSVSREHTGRNVPAATSREWQLTDAFSPTRTNIPGNRVAEGQETCPYLPPFPARGSGFHRFAFLLFKQDKSIDFSGDTRPSPCYQLAQRTFHTFDFYKKHQDTMTPAGLAFFQCRWDDSVTHIFHQLLDMREPVFEFVRPPPYHPKQKRFPHRQPLRYLDRYRDSHEPTYGIY